MWELYRKYVTPLYLVIMVLYAMVFSYLLRAGLPHTHAEDRTQSASNPHHMTVPGASSVASVDTPREMPGKQPSS